MSCQWVTVPDAAVYLSVHKRTLWNLIKAGDIPHARLGPRSIRLCVQELDRYMKRGQVDVVYPDEGEDERIIQD